VTTDRRELCDGTEGCSCLDCAAERTLRRAENRAIFNRPTPPPFPPNREVWEDQIKRPRDAPAQECRCDCVNCVTGNHGTCYYRPTICPWTGGIDA
jgi:hypothetical protein